MSDPEFREFRVSTDSMRRTGGAKRTRKNQQASQVGGAAPAYSEMGAPVTTIGVVADGMKEAASHGSTAYAQTAQGVTPMSASGTLTSQIIQPIAMGQDPLGSPASVALAQKPMAGGSAVGASSGASQKVELRGAKTRVALRGPRAYRKNMTASPVGGAKTLKARKIGLAVKSMSKKLKKAHKTAKKVASMSIDSVKAALVKAGVLKGGSKAPAELMRKMYKDLRTMRSGL
jgi:hypothetical protein